MCGELDDYHPPPDIRAGERFLSQVYEAVRNSPAWERTALLRTLRERFDLGPALTRRDAAAPSLEVAFNRSEPRTDRPGVTPPPDVEPPPLTREQQQEAFRDAPDAGLLPAKRKQAAREHVSQIGAATLRNAARVVEHDLDALPATATEARAWLAGHRGRLFAEK